MNRFGTVLCSSIILGAGVVQAEIDDLLLNVFPPSTAVQPFQGKTRISKDFTSSDSLWGPGLDERKVFLNELKNEQTPLTSYALRIGKGGQVYSLRGAFGESVPPSNIRSPWNDEVWQFVSVCTRYNFTSGSLPQPARRQLAQSGYCTTFFVHDSGAYVQRPCDLPSLYCPLLAYDASTREGRVRTLNWGLVPQQNTIHRSSILYYTQFRNRGDGVIELTWVVHNFSVRDDVVYDYFNAPWGGTRLSRLPVHHLALADGSLISRREMARRNIHDGIPAGETGGWNISSQSEAADSPSIALVFGCDPHLSSQLAEKKAGRDHFQFKASVYQDWDAVGNGYAYDYQDWKTRPENDWRNYEVAFIVPRFRLPPQSTIWYRSFFVIGGRAAVMEKAKEMVRHVDYGRLSFPTATTPKVYIHAGETIRTSKTPLPDSIVLFAHPVSGSLPLFWVKHGDTGKSVITTDPYCFTDQKKIPLDLPPDPKWDYWRETVGYDLSKNHSEWKALLGYALREKPGDSSYRPLSTVLPSACQLPFNTYNLNLWVQTNKEENNK